MAKKIDKTQWPDNLFNDILPENEVYIPPVQLIGLTEAMKELTEQEQRYLDMRYRLYMTLREIADKENLTRERIRQVLAKGCRRLGAPRRRKMIFGEYGTLTDLKTLQKDLAKERAALDEYRDRLCKDNKKYNILGKTIDDIPLSVRAYNCLKRSDLYYLEDIVALVKKDPSCLMNISNMGKKSVDEVLNALSYYLTEECI